MNKVVVKWIRKSISTLFFLGYIPLMPGTIGAFFTVITLWFLRDKLAFMFLPSGYHYFWYTAIALIAGAIWLSQDAIENFGNDDPKHVIIDEVVGQFITFFMIPLSWRTLIVGFLLFRFFDIIKPFPIHRFEEIDDGVGITMDDVAAGVLANISLVIILGFYHVIKARL